MRNKKRTPGKYETAPFFRVTNNEIKSSYDKQSDPRYAAARLWSDEIILPNETREKLSYALSVISNIKKIDKPNYGVLQV